MKKIIFLTVLLIAGLVNAQEDKSGVKYEYRQYEKFDLESIDVEGGKGAPGDLSINPRLRQEFKNRLPERKNFHAEMKKAIDAIR